MKKIIYLLVLTLSLLSFTNTSHSKHHDQQTSVNQKQDSVYICNSRTAYAYHSTLNCRGLNRCTHGVVKVSLYDAIQVYGRRACEICKR